MVSKKESSEIFDNILFPKIFQTFRIAIHWKTLTIAFLAVAVICLAGWVMDFSKTVVCSSVPQDKAERSKTAVIEGKTVPGQTVEVPVENLFLGADAKGRITELQVYLADADGVESYIETFGGKGERTGVFSALWGFAAAKFRGAVGAVFAFDIPGVVKNIADYFRAVEWALRYHFVYCIIFFIIKLVVISICGGAICRVAVLQFARGEKPGLTEALRFSTKKFTSFFCAPLTPVAMIIFVGLFVFLLGLIGNIPWVGELLMGIFMFLALLAGALITVILVGTFAGFNLMFPAVAYDGSDCFDAISRSFSYVYSKPWRMGFYTAIAAVYGAICYMFVRVFAFLLLWVTHRFLQLGVLGDNSKITAIWPGPSFGNLLGPVSPSPANWTQSFAAFLVYLCLLVVIGLVVSFIMSFYFSANTIIYSLMRNRVDNTALDDVYTSSDESGTEQTAKGSEDPKTQPD